MMNNGPLLLAFATTFGGAYAEGGWDFGDWTAFLLFSGIFVVGALACVGNHARNKRAAESAE